MAIEDQRCGAPQIWCETTQSCVFSSYNCPDWEDPESPPEEQDIYNQFNCIPGTMYIDVTGNTRYCPKETDISGNLDFETSWAEQAGAIGHSPLLDVLTQNPTFLQNFDLSAIMNLFPDLPSAGFDLAREDYTEALSGYRQEKGVQRSTMADMLKGSAVESGVELEASGFAGGGAYGREAGRERQKTLRDYRQSMQDINLSMAEADVGFEEEIENMRFEYGEDIADVMANLYSLDPSETEWAAGTPCTQAGQIYWEGVCTNIEDIPELEAYTSGWIDWS